MREEQEKPMLSRILALMNSEKMITRHNMQSKGTMVTTRLYMKPPHTLRN